MLRTHTGRHCPKVARFMKPLRPSLQGSNSELSMRHVLLRAGAPCADPTNEIERGNVNRFFLSMAMARHGSSGCFSGPGPRHVRAPQERTRMANRRHPNQQTKDEEFKAFLRFVHVRTRIVRPNMRHRKLVFPKFLTKISRQEASHHLMSSVGAGPRRCTDGLAFINM